MSKYGCGIKVHSGKISHEILCSKHTSARNKVSQNSPKSASIGSVVLYEFKATPNEQNKLHCTVDSAVYTVHSTVNKTVHNTVYSTQYSTMHSTVHSTMHSTVHSTV